MERIEKKSSDFLLVLLLVLLVGIGISMLYSASYYRAEVLDKGPFYFFYKQLLWVVLGAILAFIASCTPMDFIRKLIPYFVTLSFILILLTFIPGIGEEIKGSRRWIFLFNFSFQPSELAKVTIILYLASYFSKKERNLNDFLHSFLPFFIIISVFVGLILLQNDFSTALFIFIIAILMSFIARLPLYYYLFLFIVVAPLSIIFLFIKEHRVWRLIYFFFPQFAPEDVGYQVIQSKLALINGGLWGKGLGMGVKKLGVLPEAHSDFIFAVVGEEMGFIGFIFILILFTIFAYRGYMIALRIKDNFMYYLAFGITTSIFLQALLNMAVVSGLLPATGIPLPFFSAGGSSLLMSLFMVGLLVNISKEVESRKDYLDV